MVIWRHKFAEKEKEMYRNKKKTAREGRAKLLFLFIKYAKFVALLLLSRLIFYAPYFGFGNSLTNWIRTSYNKTESSVLNNGWSSNFFKLQRGVRQGWNEKCSELLGIPTINFNWQNSGYQKTSLYLNSLNFNTTSDKPKVYQWDQWHFYSFL